MATVPTDDGVQRRPLASRSTGWARWLSSTLVRAGASPNAISVAGLAFGVAAGGALVTTAHADDAWARPGYVVGAALIQLRLLCNLLDGMVAVEGGKRSPLGELFNEAPDRASDVATIVGAGYSAAGTASWGWAAACAALFVAYVRALGRTAGAPNDFCGPMAKPHRMALLTGACLAHGLLPAEWTQLQPALTVMDVALAVLVVGGLVTAARRLVRAGRFLRGAR